MKAQRKNNLHTLSICMLVFHITLAVQDDLVGKPECEYNNKTVNESNCDTTTNKKTVSFKLNKGPDHCPEVKEESMDCGCEYEEVSKGECKDGKQDIQKKLITGADSCPKEENGIVDCVEETNQNKDDVFDKVIKKVKKGRSKVKKNKKNKNRKTKKDKRRRGCVYKKKPWSKCSFMNVRATRRRVLVLIHGDPAQCQPKKTVKKPCRKVCRYKKGKWSPCSAATGEKTRRDKPKKGSPRQCRVRIKSKLCPRRAELKGPKINKCKYTFSEWSPCNPRTDTMSRSMTLKSGDPNVCLRSKILTKKCRIACKFRRGNWSECDKQSHLTVRIDTLYKGASDECEQQRTITKKCRKSVCKYSLGEWSECDPVTNMRTRVKTLIKSGRDRCKREEQVTRPCTKSNGQARCFYGPWGEFGPCKNGVMTKQRPMIQGGVTCERKAVVTKACTNTFDTQ